MAPHTKVYLFTLILLPAILQAQFSGPFSIDAAFNGRILHPADLDSDGDIDLAAGGDSGRQWYRNDGQGQFSAAIPINGAAETKFLDIADMDNDGDMDILFQDRDFAYWQRNEGNEVFSEEMRFNDYDDIATGIVAEDVDLDGYQDIIWGAYNTANTVILNNGDGTFGSPTNIVGFGYDSFNMGDFNQDGFPDMLLTHSDGFAAFTMLNDGAGHFINGPTVAYDNQNSPLVRPLQGFIADIDEDGFPDALYYSAGRPDTYWHRNQNGNSFAFGATLLSNHTVLTDATDVNRDGLLDLLTIGGGVIAWHRQLYNFRFQADTITAGTIVSSQPGSYRFADLDGDQYPDLAIILQNGSLVWYRNEMGTPAAVIHCFWDKNGNGQQEADEEQLNGLAITLQPFAQDYYTNSQGQIRLFLPPGDYTFHLQTTGCWMPVSQTTSYSFTWNGSDTALFEIGCQLLQNGEPAFSLELSSAATRCGREVPFWLSLSNTACISEPGVIALILDSRAQLLASPITPALINGDTLWWAFDEIPPGNQEQWPMLLEMPGAGLAGDTLSFQWFLYTPNCATGPDLSGPVSDLTQGLFLCQSKAYTPVLRCSYGPNDKQVEPYRSELHNFTLFEEELAYTIRFQNTGNDTVFTVWIKDQLDQRLDWNSLRALGASHPFEMQVAAQTGELSFIFPHILLPDSTSNEPASHGYVQYAIRPRQDLPENARITNQARIIFDNNPPVFTNTVESEMVSALPQPRIPRAAFDFSIDGFVIFLCDLSAYYPSAWHWDFGDGAASALANPRHTYANAGAYELCLVASNEQGSDTLCRMLTVGETVNLAFSGARILHANAFNAATIYPADLDGDGDFDLAAALAGRAAYFSNDGNGNFADPVFIDDEAGSIACLVVAGLGQDGAADMLAAAANGQVRWYQNNGAGIFAPPLNIATRSAELRRIHPADVDGDGDIDVVVGWMDFLAWMENDGSAIFSSTHLISDNIPAAQGIDVADIDLDGDQDILISTRYEVFLFEHVGRTAFKPRKVIDGLEDGESAVIATDLTRDGLPDVFYFSAYAFMGLNWKQNEGGVQFSARNSFANYNFIHAIAAADLDNDGDPEAIAGEESGKLSWYRNQAGTTFSDQQIIDGDYAFGPVFAIDIDLDGDEDLITIWQDQEGQIVWYENQLQGLPPAAHFTYGGGGPEIQFTDLSTNAPTYWQWWFGDGGESSDQHPAHVYVNPGAYQVSLLAGNSAGSDTTSQLIQIILDNVSGIEAPYPFVVLPNPTHGQAAIRFDTPLPSGSYCQLYDLAGVPLGRPLLVSGQQINLELGLVPGGVYAFHVFVQERILARGLIIKTQ